MLMRTWTNRRTDTTMQWECFQRTRQPASITTQLPPRMLTNATPLNLSCHCLVCSTFNKNCSAHSFPHYIIIMPPRDNQYYHQHSDSIEERAAVELDVMARSSSLANKLHPLPPACLAMLRSLSGNDKCIDCGARHPEWATISYGALLCLECSGNHRSLGVQVRGDNFFVVSNASHSIRISHLLMFSLLLFRLLLYVHSSWIIGHMNKCWPCVRAAMNNCRSFLIGITWLLWKSAIKPRRLAFIVTNWQSMFPN